jgi:hypothetical protein
MAVYDGMDPQLSFEREIPRLGAESWAALCADGGLPGRNDIDPLKLPRAVLPHILLIDVEDGAARRFRWRLIGTHTTTVLGRDSTGRYLDEVLPADRYGSFIEPLNWVIEHRRPTRIWGRATHVEKTWVPFENFLAPMVDDEGIVVMLFGVTFYEDPLSRGL